MKKRLAIFLVWTIYFFGGFWMGFALSGCPEAQDGYQCYCPEDGSTCYNVAPLKDVATPSVGSSSALGLQGNAMQTLLQVSGGDNSANNNTNVTLKDNFLRNIQIYIMGLLWIVSVSVFLYIGYMLFTAEGKEEEFKKAWKALVYAVIGLAVIPLAFIAVKIVTGFTL